MFIPSWQISFDQLIQSKIRFMRALSWQLLIFALTMAPAASARDVVDRPTGPAQDAVMPAAAEAKAVSDWVAEAFGLPGSETNMLAIGVESLYQDHCVLQSGRSCIGTPLRIGQRGFAQGLGTHANGEIRLRLPSGARIFQCLVGIDNNSDTGGTRGSAQFAVTTAGRELTRTRTLRGGEEPVALKVALPAGTRELVLKTDGTPDGVAHDHADWCDISVVLEDGHVARTDDWRPTFMEPRLPFSFTLDGKPGGGILRSWTRSAATSRTPERTIHTIRWSDPQTRLEMTAAVTEFKRYAAAEWVLAFENNGAQNSGIIEDVAAVDTWLRTGYMRKPALLHRLSGDVCGEQSFLPLQAELEPGKPVRFAPVGGRSSSGAFPFFTVDYDGEGMIAAIGWSGQWAASLERMSTGPTRLTAGVERTRFRLHPGERVRGPRILLMPWQGDPVLAHNRFRRLLLFEYAPRQEGRPLQMPVALQSYDRYVQARPDWGTEAVQLQAARQAHAVGCDMHWLDAAWFVGDFPNGVGNWFCKPQGFPRGLKPISDACHQLGMDFMVWFEPERVAVNTRFAREQAPYVLGGTNGGLFKLHEPEARRWLADHLSGWIREFGMDVYRNDFNTDPLDAWRKADAPDRQGITEMQYIEGLYALWDELRARQPGLWIDNCSGGGRRLDIETLSRSVPLWRSDTGCAPGHMDWDQTQIMGLAQYVPLFGGCSWEPKAYDLRSSGTSGIICQFDILNPQFDMTAARSALEEVKANRKFWYGDFYPLTPPGTGPGAMAAWQLHRPDLNAGIVLAFRRSGCPYSAMQVGLRGLDAAVDYTVDIIDEARRAEKLVVSGQALTNAYELRLPVKGASLLVRYQQAAGK
jgi:alpha-galactosidase